jgi:DNA-3-methyladenine glycosylase I
MDEATRCPWCGTDPLYVAYHDKEWGVPCHDERTLFEFLILEGAQAGLSWLTILRKRQAYRHAFDDFDAERIARYGAADGARLLANAGIVRNRLKIAAAIGNAQAYLDLREQTGGLDSYLWSFVDGQPIQNAWRRMEDVPASTPLASTLSKDLSQRGFRFVGPTICYSLMQAVGLVNDHLVSCRRHLELRN